MSRRCLGPILLPLLIFEAFFVSAQQGFSADRAQLPHIEQSDIEKLIEQRFTLNDPDYVATRAGYAEKLDPLIARLIALQKQGRNMACSDQMMVEARWLLEHTTAWARLDAQLAKLSESLQYRDQTFATKQSREGGAWGACYDEWFLKVDATIDALNKLADRGEAPQYPLTLLERIGSPDSLITYLEGLLVSDVAGMGVDQRDELGAVTGALSQMLFKERLRQFFKDNVKGFVINDGYVDSYRRFLDAWQDPLTGYWGAWYRFDSKLYKSTDLSLTFHTVSYRKGNVRYWPKIVDTTFAINAYEYPYGWKHNGSYTHHNNYDILKILRYGWPHMNDEQKERGRSEIRAMLKWCLSMPMQADSLFAIDPTFYSNLSSYYYYGISFLDEIGYWNKSRRFWTDQDFPKAHAMCHLIKAKLTSLNLNTPPAAAAMIKLEANCPAT